MMDMIQALEPSKNYPFVELHYVWFDTGIEYTITKAHLAYLEEKYGITIERRRAKTPVPLGCKTYGLPFLSKDVSQKIETLQNHGFEWKDEPLEVLMAKYPGIESYLKWWCNAKQGTRFSIENYRLLKEFLIENPPTFKISDRCCKGAKKHVAADYMKEVGATIQMLGVRKAEGGLRATAYTSCFSEPSKRGEAAQFRPIFFLTDRDKQIYSAMRNVVYSDLYTKHGFERTGCAGCTFNRDFDQALEVTRKVDPGLALAAENIFGPAYEYTRAYYAFKAQHDADKKRGQNQVSLWN